MTHAEHCAAARAAARRRYAEEDARDTARRRAMREKERAELADARRRRARVLAVEGNGKFVTVEFRNDAGERVIAVYSLNGYILAPSDVLARFNEAQRNGPTMIFGRRPG